MWMKILLLSIVVLVVIVTIVFVYGSNRWRTSTQEMQANLDASRLPIEPKTYDSKEIEGLPATVQRYFRTVLKDVQPMISAVSVEYSGTFKMSETGEKWKPFTLTHRIIIHLPGFDWAARIQIAAGITVLVHDAYIAGEGILHGTRFGLLSLVHSRGTFEVTQEELMRFFAHASWYPTKLLPSQDVHREPVDNHSARATLKDDNSTLTMLFRFKENGLLESVPAEARAHTVGGSMVPTPPGKDIGITTKYATECTLHLREKWHGCSQRDYCPFGVAELPLLSTNLPGD